MIERITIRTPADLGAAIRAVRIAAGLTQADAAALCGVSGPFLSGLEQGKETARLGLALTVCQELGICLELGLPEKIPSPKPGSARRVSRKAHSHE
ncbi:MAG: helix-turn-helix domain-containing protein [Deltaproteobacteria bacterium]|nr:helix-turn-helix domain-containing protein [Deltaproteobacteria bacterium]